MPVRTRWLLFTRPEANLRPGMIGVLITTERSNSTNGTKAPALHSNNRKLDPSARSVPSFITYMRRPRHIRQGLAAKPGSRGVLPRRRNGCSTRNRLGIGRLGLGAGWILR